MHSCCLHVVALCGLGILGCSGAADAPQPQVAIEGIRDIRELPQDPLAYVAGLAATGPEAGPHQPVPGPDQPLLDPARQGELFRQFRQQWLAAWEKDAARPGIPQVEQPAIALLTQPGFAENLRPHTPRFAREMVDAVRGPACDWPAVTVVNTDLRRLPTHRPRFDAVDQAGEGFPFDSLQESALWAGTPLRVWQSSPDGQWVLVDSPCGCGWTPARDVARVDGDIIGLYRQAPLAALVRDGVTLRDADGSASLTTHIGAVFPIARTDAGAGVVRFPVRDADGLCRLLEARLGPADAAVMPLPTTPATVASLASHMIGQPYGWGGMFEDRDCSSTVRDLMVPFGVPLPRNSGDQAGAYASVRLDHLAPPRRERAILDRGRPFMTLVCFRGHVALYLGEHRGRAIILHNTWGLRTRVDGREGRRIIGRCVITTLQPGLELAELDRPRGDLRNNVQSMVLLGQQIEGGR